MHRRYLKSLAGLTVAAYLALPASAQQAAVHPVKDAAIVYSSFFFFMEDFSAWLNARAIAAPANKTKLMESAARYLHISADELPKVSATCQSFAAILRQINMDAHSYAASSAMRQVPPDAASLAAYEAQRQSAIQSAMVQLKQNLSAAGWNGLYAHINGEYRNGIVARTQSVPVSAPVPNH